MGELLEVFDSRSEAYRRAFEVFLAHTDQKQNTRKWLERLIATLPSRDVFIDAGAGTGEVTRWIANSFSRTIAIEPNPYLREDLRESLPDCELLAESLSECRPPAQADLVLCSHVLYFVDRARWMSSLEQLVGWLNPGGAAVVILQNARADLSRLRHHFLGLDFDLEPLGTEFERRHGPDYSVRLDTVHCRFKPPDAASARAFIESMLSDFPAAHPIRWRDVDQYLSDHFGDPSGYPFSCDEDCLQIRRRR